MSFKKLFLIPLVCLFITTPFLAFASGSKTITRGDAVTITWDVTGATSCTPNTTYPFTGDNVKSDWDSSGTSTTGQVLFASVYQNQPDANGYSFSCSNAVFGIEDKITLYVNDCPANTPWDTGPDPFVSLR